MKSRIMNTRMRHIASWVKGNPSTVYACFIVAMYIALAAAQPALAASGIAKLDSTLDKISTGLLGIGVVLITIALTYAGYKLAFHHATMAEIAKPVGGGLLAGSAAAIAGWIMA